MPKKEEATPTQEYPLAVLLTTFSTVLTMSRLMEFYVCVMMFVFMTLSDSLLCNDCWYIVDLLPIMTSVAQLGSSFVHPPSLLSSILLPNPLEDVKKEVQDTDSNSIDLQASAMVEK